jgi:CheY-like chemotaxis protein
MNILIAEDNPLIQHIHHHMMEQWGFDYDLATDGVEAVALALKNRGRYDLALMDVEMPHLNGIEAARRIRRSVGYFPIAAYTGETGYRRDCLGAGMDAFIEKPGEPDDILEYIRLLTVKQIKVELSPNGCFNLSEEMPMDPQHAEELRELAKQKLRKVMFFDSPASTVIVHENLLNKISHDFNVKKQLLTTFVNRDRDKPTVCHLYRESNYLMPQLFITEEEYEALIKAEDGELDRFDEPVLKEDGEKYDK